MQGPSLKLFLYIFCCEDVNKEQPITLCSILLLGACHPMLAIRTELDDIDTVLFMQTYSQGVFIVFN